VSAASSIISLYFSLAPTGYPSTEEQPKYPEEVLNEFSETENFVSLAKDTKFIDYQKIVLIGAREGRDVIKNEIGIEIEEKSPESADIFDKLKVRKDQVPIRPLTEGILE
jgi:tRNA(Ser,Leu) C12 N-acetylase TAN1